MPGFPTSILTPPEEEILAKAIKRVHQMDTAWLLDFAEQSITGMSMGLEDWRRLAQVESMDEIKGGVLCLMAAVWEIMDRHEAGLTG